MFGSRRVVQRKQGVAVKGAIPDAAAAYNAASALTIPTYDGSGETVHPSVIDFLTQHGQATWNGHRYWLAITPFPSGNADYENPSIMVSSDGLSWSAPDGITNPIDGPPTPEVLAATTAYYSDPEIVYDPTGDRLICYYRYFQNDLDDKYVQYYRTSTDGVTWSSRTEFASGNAGWYISPTVVRLDSDVWYSWDVENSGPANTVRRRTSTDGLTWSASELVVCTFVGLPETSEPWHVSVSRRDDGSFLMLLNTNLSIDPSPAGNALQLATSTDGATWNVSDVVIATGTTGAFDDYRIYRASGYVQDDVVRVWYGGTKETGSVWKTGYTEIPVSELPVPA